MLLELINYVFPRINYAYGENLMPPYPPAAYTLARPYTPLLLSDATRREKMDRLGVSRGSDDASAKIPEKDREGCLVGTLWMH